MASTPENKAKRQVDALLNLYPIYWFPPNTGGYGKSGLPDRVGCHRGKFFGVEVKADTNVTALQAKNLREIEKAGGKAFVVRINAQGAHGMGELDQWLAEVECEYQRQVMEQGGAAVRVEDSKSDRDGNRQTGWRVAE